MRKALRPSGRLAFAVLAREPRENPFFMAPLRRPTSTCRSCRSRGRKIPGRLRSLRRRVSAASSTRQALPGQMEPCPLLLDAAIGRGLDGAVQGALEIGPVSRALEDQPADLRAAAAPLRSATRCTPFAKRATRCLLPASVWIVTARAS